MSRPIFTPRLCTCGCKKWIMSPWFGCQCSSLSTEAKDELMDIARDAMRYRELRQHKVMFSAEKTASIAEQCSLDAVTDIFMIGTSVEGDSDAPGS